MNQLSITNKRIPTEIFFVAIFGTIISFFLNDYTWIGIIALLVAGNLFFYHEKFFIPFAFFTLVIAVSNFSVTLRTVVQLFNIPLLFYFFIKYYGTDYTEYPRIPKQIIYFILSIIFVMCVSIIFSSYPSEGYPQLIRTMIFFIIIYLFYALLVKTQNIELYLKPFLVAAAFLLAVLFYFFYLKNFNVFEFNKFLLLKEDEFFINRNGIGAFFVISISLLTPFLFYDYTAKKKVAISFFITALLFGLFIANSRASILSLCISLAFILFVLNKKYLIRFALMLVSLVPLIFIKPIADFIGLYFRVERLTSGRDLIWETTYNVIKNNFLFGSGPAATKFEMYKHIPFMFGSPEERILSMHINRIKYGHAHDFYLFFFSDLGILGLVISLTLPFLYLSIGFKTLRSLKGRKDKYYYLTIGLIGAGIAMFVRAIFEWGGLISYGAISGDLPFWWIFCILIYIYSKYVVKSDTKQN